MVRYLLGSMLLVGLALVVTVTMTIGQAEDPPRVDELVLPVFAAWTAGYLVIAVVTLVDARAMHRRDDLDGLRRATRVVKLMGIPFFVINFVLLGLAVFVGMFAHGIGIVLAPVFVAWTYLLMLPTSIYGIACLVLMRRLGAASSGYVALNTVLHLVFVVDIVSTLIVARDAGRFLSVRRSGVATGGQPPGPAWAPR